MQEEQSYIEIINASENNLKNVSLKIPREKFVVFTGLSGSGKTSLAFDTLYAEGQRRYVESLSSYARQFLGKIKKPSVEHIKGLPPAIAIEQKTLQSNPRSTVGTSTEIYDYLKLLFARIGKTYSPISGNEVKKHTIDDVVNFISTLDSNYSVLILSPVSFEKKNIQNTLKNISSQGFRRVEIETKNLSQTILIDELLENTKLINTIEKLFVVIDRLMWSNDDDTLSRIADSVQTAFFEGAGECIIKATFEDKTIMQGFSNRFDLDGIEFEEPSINLFNFNNPLGSCPVCNGFGTTLDYSEDLIIPNKSLSIYDDAVACWRGESLSFYKKKFIQDVSKLDFPIFEPYYKLSNQQKDILWNGNNKIDGIKKIFENLETEYYKVQNRVLIARYRDKTICRACNGTRLRKETDYVKINSKSIKDLVILQISELKKFFDNIKLSDKEHKIAKQLLQEIKQRIDYLCNVGLDYLTLNRASNTLSGGEMQRINLSTALGSSLVGSLYVLDEPTIGLHARDTSKLIGVIKNLTDIGNTVVVVEHEPKVIENADWIVDLGPKAGAQGGQIVFEGDFEQLKKENTLTANYLNGKQKVTFSNFRKKHLNSNGYIEIKNAYHNNLKNISLNIPLERIVAITGVSGSGKSTLIKNVVYPWLMREYGVFSNNAGRVDYVKIVDTKIDEVVLVDQNPVGKSTRSNAATYIGAYDDIRRLFSSLPLAKLNEFTHSHFSFNVDGGRCEECQGEGLIKIEMQFMSDVTMVCESCNGRRFKEEVLEVKFEDVNIFELLEMTIDQAVDFFSKNTDKIKNLEKTINNIINKLNILSKVGLGYIKLGQSTSTLSGGENQRLKLANFMSNDNKNQKVLFIFDEPTTGLHFDDVNRLLNAFGELVNKGHSIIFIEHNLDMIKNADWVVDLGPEGGEKGGNVVFEGIPVDLANVSKSYTGKYLKENF